MAGVPAGRLSDRLTRFPERKPVSVGLSQSFGHLRLIEDADGMSTSDLRAQQLSSLYFSALLSLKVIRHEFS